MISIKIYGTKWCINCRNAIDFLKQHKLDFEFIDIELDRRAAVKIKAINAGKMVIPAISINDIAYFDPDYELLSRKLGLNKQNRIIIYGIENCPHCQNAISYFEERKINYQFVDVDNFYWATKEVMRLNKGHRVLPTITLNEIPFTSPEIVGYTFI